MFACVCLIGLNDTKGNESVRHSGSLERVCQAVAKLARSMLKLGIYTPAASLQWDRLQHEASRERCAEVHDPTQTNQHNKSVATFEVK